MISICIPAYKHLDILPDALQSICSQNSDFELVILDDFDIFLNDPSLQPKVKHVRELYSSDPRIKWFRNSEHLPIQANWNKVISLSSRPYIKMMGADDRLHPGAIEKMESMIKAFPAVVLHGHLADVIDSNGLVVRKPKPYPGLKEPLIVSGNAALKGKLRQIIRFKNPVCNIFKRTAWEQVGGYSNKYRFCFDTHFNTRVMAGGECALWNENLVDLRRHDHSDGATLPAKMALDELRNLVADILSEIGDEVTAADLIAANGWILYRLFELAAQRIMTKPGDLRRLFIENYSVLLSSPAVYKQAAKLAISRIRDGDIQQKS